MIDPSILWVFVLACVALVASPGPAFFYIMASSIQGGRLAGFVSMLGIGLGTVAHIVAAAVGVSALLMSSALAFNMVKYAGAAYLVYLGIRTLRSKRGNGEVTMEEGLPAGQVFYQAFLVNLLNPKTAIFFLAFLPQFVDPLRGDVTMQVLVLGLILILVGFVNDIVIVLLTSSVGNWMQRNPRAQTIQRYVSGGTFLTLGIAAAFSNFSQG